MSLFFTKLVRRPAFLELLSNPPPFISLCFRSVSTSGVLLEISDDEKKRKELETRINVIGIDKSFNVMTLEQAQKMATRRTWVLEPVPNPPKWASVGLRPVYQFYTTKRFKKEEITAPQNRTFRGSKTMKLKTQTMDNDLAFKMKMANEWLTKNYQVLIHVDLDSKGDDKNIFQKKIEKMLGAHVRLPGTVQVSSSRLLRIMYEPSQNKHSPSDTSASDKNFETPPEADADRRKHGQE